MRCTSGVSERKLFVGMLSKKYGENEVRKLFSPFGSVEECAILRDSNGHSKGCAFVIYDSQESALNAIKTMNHSQIMEGCNSPIVVKFANAQKEKDSRKPSQHQLLQQLLAAAMSPSPAIAATPPPASNPLSPGGPGAGTTATLRNAAVNWNGKSSSGNSILGLLLREIAAAAANVAQQQQIAAAAATLALSQQLGAVAANNTDSVTLTAARLAPVLAVALCGSTPTTNGGAVNGLTSTPQSCTNLTGLNFVQTPYSTRISSVSNLNKLTQRTSPQSSSNNSATKQMEGPEGSNLFIYHLPAHVNLVVLKVNVMQREYHSQALMSSPDYTDSDLAQTFASFGNVISSKVFIDKNTNLSKCFGFVSFDNPISAYAAIQAMNGFQIGNKRLKVQLKKIKEKPY